VGVAAEQDLHERTVVERRDPLLGQTFDRRFRIEAKIAAGGFGAIYRVTHIRSGQAFALKLLHPNLTNDPKVVARFRREGATLTRLRDPHTITAYELGEAQDGTLYILMELLRGESLFERFRSQGALPWRPVLALARAVCNSLSEAHGLGIIHRDLKPTNIHLEPGEDDVEFVKVLDFGIAKILQGSDFDSSELTYAGQMIGTLDYMSPEQMVGGQCLPSSDLYTLGVVMYEMIAGKKPFDDANSAAAALAAVLTVTPDRLSTRAMVPVDVDRIVMRCLERQHADRFQTAGELAEAIDELFEGEDQVTSIAPANRMPSPIRAMPKATTPPKPIVPADNPAAPPANHDSTLVGHEPVARLPAGPMRGPAAPAGAPPGRAPAPTTVPPPGSSQVPAPATRALLPATPPGSDRRALGDITSGNLASGEIASGEIALDSIGLDPTDSAGTAFESTQDDSVRAAQLEITRDGTQDDEAPSATARQTTTPPHIAAARRALTPRTGMPVASPQGTPSQLAARYTPPAGIPVPSSVPPSPPAVGARPITALHAAQLGTPQVPTTNLREAYPTIHRQPPSPTRPQPTQFDDRPATGVKPFDMARAVRSDTLVRRLAVIIGLVIAALVAIWFASRM
jgi:serine/threonine protein kinase